MIREISRAFNGDDWRKESIASNSTRKKNKIVTRFEVKIDELDFGSGFFMLMGRGSFQ